MDHALNRLKLRQFKYCKSRQVKYTVDSFVLKRRDLLNLNDFLVKSLYLAFNRKFLNFQYVQIVIHYVQKLLKNGPSFKSTFRKFISCKNGFLSMCKWIYFLNLMSSIRFRIDIRKEIH